MHANRRNLTIALAIAVMTLGAMPVLEGQAEAGLFGRRAQAKPRVTLRQRFVTMKQGIANWRAQRKASFRTPARQRVDGQVKRQNARTTFSEGRRHVFQGLGLRVMAAGARIGGDPQSAAAMRQQGRESVRFGAKLMRMTPKMYAGGVKDGAVGQVRRPFYATRKWVGRQASRAVKAADKHVVQPVNRHVVQPAKRAVGTGLAYGEVGLKAGRVALRQLGQGLKAAPGKIRGAVNNMGIKMADYAMDHGVPVSDRTLNRLLYSKNR